MARLDKIEKENDELRAKVRDMSATRAARPGPVASVASAPSAPTGNPVLHAAVATSPPPPPPVPGMPVKATGWGPVVDNTVVTLYGHFDLSGDVFNPSVFCTKSRCFFWPSDLITMSHSSTNSLPLIGSGAGRPEASGLPSFMRTHSMPSTTPLPTIRFGAVRK
jgi:hypothetical protein